MSSKAYLDIAPVTLDKTLFVTIFISSIARYISFC